MKRVLIIVVAVFCILPTSVVAAFDDWEIDMTIPGEPLRDPQTGRYADENGNVYHDRDEYLDAISEDYYEIDCCEECFGIDGEHADGCSNGPENESDYSGITYAEQDAEYKSELDSDKKLTMLEKFLLAGLGLWFGVPILYMFVFNFGFWIKNVARRTRREGRS